jgi:hypothetical protein
VSSASAQHNMVYDLGVELESMDAEVDFNWPSNLPTGDPTQCHKATIELLKLALKDSVTASKVQIWARAQEVADLKRVITMATAKDNKFKAQFWQIERLVREHGYLSQALESSIQVGSDARVGLNMLVKLMGQVREMRLRNRRR